jgi:hypothetical protein
LTLSARGPTASTARAPTYLRQVRLRRRWWSAKNDGRRFVTCGHKANRSRTSPDSQVWIASRSGLACARPNGSPTGAMRFGELSLGSSSSFSGSLPWVTPIFLLVYPVKKIAEGRRAPRHLTLFVSARFSITLSRTCPPTPWRRACSTPGNRTRGATQVPGSAQR